LYPFHLSFLDVHRGWVVAPHFFRMFLLNSRLQPLSPNSKRPLEDARSTEAGVPRSFFPPQPLVRSIALFFSCTFQHLFYCTFFPPSRDIIRMTHLLLIVLPFLVKLPLDDKFTLFIRLPSLFSLRMNSRLAYFSRGKVRLACERFFSSSFVYATIAFPDFFCVPSTPSAPNTLGAFKC